MHKRPSQHSKLSAGIPRRRFLAASLATCSAPALLRAAESGVPKDVPWLADVQRPPAELSPDAPQLEPLLVDHAGEVITTLAGWHTRRQSIRRRWLEFLGPLASAQRPAVPRLEVLAEDRADGVLRQRLRYEVEPGVDVEAYLLKPVQVDGPCPGAAVFHSTVNHTIRQPAGVEGRPEKAFGLKLAQRGFVALCPRNFLWPGEGKISTAQTVAAHRARHPHSQGMAKMLYDSLVAVDILASLPEVDSNRLSAVGHSLGAKEVLYLAAFDPRVRVTVSSEGGIGTRFSNWHDPWYLGEAIRSEDFRGGHHELLALAAPRPFLLLGGDSADGDRSWSFIEAALPVYHLYETPARLGLFNHRKGHSVPPEAERRIYQWIQAYC